jgi:alkanesulfonate monooxygenase SsuD/methylene tetrahydromethanopterin reductase-like flavin-dependent oxidoreductase (luciferase family)
MIDVGVVLPTRLRPSPLDPEAILRMAETADGVSGWDHLWVTDSVISLPFYDSVVLLAACAARTNRVRLGVACQASLGLRQPLVVAQQWANLDVLSGGRMTFVACPGEATGPTRVHELAAFNMDHAEKVARMEENLEFLRAVSAGGPVSFSGTYFAIDDLDLAPAFVQSPLPIWMAGNPPAGASLPRVRRVLDRVARLGDGWLTFAVTPDTLRERRQLLEELRADLGRSSEQEFPVCVFLNVNVNPAADAALDDALATWKRQSTRNVSPDQLHEVAAIGSPEQGADFIGRLVEAGATAVAVELLSQRPQEQLDLITEFLLPLLA